MEKEFEALERLCNCYDDDYTLGYQQHDHNLLKQALTELKAIKEAKPSEAMEELEELEKVIEEITINNAELNQHINYQTLA